jgi:hypothetical protein
VAKRRLSDLLMVLVLFAVYATGAVTLAAIGSNTYKHTTEAMQADYDTRTGVLYIAEKVRQNDVGGALSLREFGDSTALVLTEQITGKGYQTWIFVSGGQLCEIMIAPDAVLDTAQTQRIMPMQDMQLSLDSQGLLEVSLLAPSGVASNIKLAVRSDAQSFLAANPGGA